MIRTKIDNYFQSTLSQMQGDSKKLFNFVSKTLDLSKNKVFLPSTPTDPIELANKINEFFVNKVHDIRRSLPSVVPMTTTSSFEDQTDGSSEDTLPGHLYSFTPCTPEEVQQIIKESGIKVSPSDVLPEDVFTDNKDIFIPFLSDLVNLSLANGTIDGLKESLVRPLIKRHGLDPNCLENYRPVSNLSFLSKLIERVVLSRLQDHMDQHNLNCNRQFGYKKKHSTESLIIKVMNDILVGMDRKKGTVVLIMDLSAAFDTVDHDKLISILASDYKIKGIALKWFESFLTSRSQRVLISSCVSESIFLSFGVPQGSVLGPILFNIYISSLSDVFAEAGFRSFGYADDNIGYQIFTASAQSEVFQVSVPNCISNVKSWMSTHFLKLNETKTKIIIFGSPSFHDFLDSTSVFLHSGEEIDLVDSIKFLGVFLDKHLSLNDHVNKLSSHCYMLLRNIRSIRRYLSQSQCELLVNASVTSRLDFSNSILYGLPNQDCIGKLKRIQNQASKLILQKGRFQGFPAPVRLQTLHWLGIEKRIIYKLLLLTYYCSRGVAPVELISLLVPHNGEQDSNVTLIFDTRFYYPYLSYGRRAFEYCAPRLWNSLPMDIRKSVSISIFKKSLKTYFFTSFTNFMNTFTRYHT